MSQSYRRRRVEDLPDDDAEAIYQLTGGLHGGAEFLRRKRLMEPERNCPPWMKTDEEMTRRFRKAVLRHEPALERMERALDSINQEIERMLKDGEITSFADIPESILVRVCMTQMIDGRRPTAVNKAVEMAAKIKGLLGERPIVGSDEVLDSLLERLDSHRSQQPTGPRPLADADDAATG